MLDITEAHRRQQVLVDENAHTADRVLADRIHQRLPALRPVASPVRPKAQKSHLRALTQAYTHDGPMRSQSPEHVVESAACRASVVGSGGLSKMEWSRLRVVPAMSDAVYYEKIEEHVKELHASMVHRGFEGMLKYEREALAHPERVVIDP